MNEREQKKKSRPFTPIFSFNLFFHRIPRNRTNKTQERLGTPAVVENCQGKSNQWPKHEQTCYSEIEFAAKMPVFHIFLVPLKTYIHKKYYNM